MIVEFRDDWSTFPCRIWSGATAARGYGYRSKNGQLKHASRWAWIEAYGDLPSSHFVMHACDNPPCYALEHLGVGTAADNTRDMVVKGRTAKKLTYDIVIDIKTLASLPNGPSQREIAEMYGLVQQTVSKILNGERWSHVSVGCDVG